MNVRGEIDETTRHHLVMDVFACVQPGHISTLAGAAGADSPFPTNHWPHAYLNAIMREETPVGQTR